MKLKIDNLEVMCVIGERADERNRLQRLVVNLELDVTNLAAETDRLEDAVDYVVLADRIRATLVAAKCRLIERAARLAYEACLAMPGVVAACAHVVKTGAVPGLERAEAVYDGR